MNALSYRTEMETELTRLRQELGNRPSVFDLQEKRAELETLHKRMERAKVEHGDDLVEKQAEIDHLKNEVTQLRGQLKSNNGGQDGSSMGID
jgi:hypothetical protein